MINLDIIIQCKNNLPPLNYLNQQHKESPIKTKPTLFLSPVFHYCKISLSSIFSASRKSETDNGVKQTAGNKYHCFSFLICFVLLTGPFETYVQSDILRLKDRPDFCLVSYLRFSKTFIFASCLRQASCISLSCACGVGCSRMLCSSKRSSSGRSREFWVGSCSLWIKSKKS